MSIFVGLRFDEETTNILAEWLDYCSKDPDGMPWNIDGEVIFYPQHKSHISIPLVYSNSPISDDRFKDFKPLGPLNETIEMINPHIRHVGERGAIVLGFTSPFVTQRYNELCDQGFKRRHGKFLPRIIISHHSHFINMGWCRKLPIRSLKVIEEFTVPFDLSFPKYAHLPSTQIGSIKTHG